MWRKFKAWQLRFHSITVLERINLVDLLTHVESVDFLISNQNWWAGPAFLKGTISEPAELDIMKAEYISELKKDFKSNNSGILITVH